ncbi:chaperonin 10-like protein [Endogone sp. FLAS-F59071]|nr:chaperonin 10-like protein [Endogone sp. FLAS-F59071]|eukprot:RUS15155.1 chaperonin 10-like protein [Endogone sp. FLAS-F59071]
MSFTAAESISIVWSKKDKLTHEKRTFASLGPNELLIRVEACGLCGTDIHICHGEFPDAILGSIIGHEFVGRIVAIGENIPSGQWQVDDRIVVDPNMPCHSCHWCRTIPAPHMCSHPKAIGISRDGGMSQYAVIPASQAYKIPHDLPAEAAALTEPLACVLHAVDIATVKPGSSALVIGAGPIGILAATVLVASGCSRVHVAESNQSRRERIKLFSPAEPIESSQIERGAYDLVLECVGLPQTLETAVEAAAPKGTVVWIGVAAPDARVSINPFDVYRKELTIRGSYTNPFTMVRAVNMLAAGQIKWEHIVTHVFSLEQFDEAWETHVKKTGLKVCVKP